MATAKRHMYLAGTINVETGNVAVKQDINYYGAGNPQSAMKSIVRFIEDSDKRFTQNQIYDGLAVSNGGANVDVASGTARIGGQWVTVGTDNLSASGLNGIYNVVLHVSGVSETNSRDPSTGEAINLYLETSGSWVDNDWKLVLGSALISSSTVTSVIDRAKRQVNVNDIKPYGTSTQVSVYTGTKPVYREAMRFASNLITPYNPFANIDVSGDSVLNAVSGSTFGAISYAIGSKVLGQSEFDNLDNLDQGVRTTNTPTFVAFTGTQASPTPPMVVASTGTVANFSAQYLGGLARPYSSAIVGIDDLQTLSNKTLLTPTIASFISGTHPHQDAAGGGIIGINVATSGTLLVGQGGTGRVNFTDGAHLLGDGTNAIAMTLRPTAGQILVGQVSGSPILDVPRLIDGGTGDITISPISLGADGDFQFVATVDDDSHSHNTQYTTQGSLNDAFGLSSVRSKKAPAIFLGTDPINAVKMKSNGVYYLEVTGTVKVYFAVPQWNSILIDGGNAEQRFYEIQSWCYGGDASNYLSYAAGDQFTQLGSIGGTGWNDPTDFGDGGSEAVEYSPNTKLVNSEWAGHCFYLQFVIGSATQLYFVHPIVEVYWDNA